MRVLPFEARQLIQKRRRRSAAVAGIEDALVVLEDGHKPVWIGKSCRHCFDLVIRRRLGNITQWIILDVSAADRTN
jgi:hypothetical protein